MRLLEQMHRFVAPATNRRVLVVNGHPDPSPERFCAALCESFSDGARAGGAEVKQLHAARVAQGASLTDAIATIAWATHLIVIFPLWLGGMPGALDALFRQNLQKSGHIVPDDRPVHTVATMDLRGFLHRKTMIDDSGDGLRLAGFVRQAQDFIGSVGSLTADQRGHWLISLRERGRRGDYLS